jgi:hypothetical protein
MWNTQTQTSKEAITGVKNLVETVGEISCPFCGKTMTNHEYDRAAQEFKRSTEEEYRQQFDLYKKGFEDQTLEQEKKHRLEIEYMKKTHLDQIKFIQKELKSAQDKQLDDLNKRYDELRLQKENDLNEKLQQVMASHQKEMKEKEILVRIMQKNQEEFKEKAIQEARATMKNEIIQKEEQIRRFKEKVEVLEKQCTLTQSELKGEAGEIDLLETLNGAFIEEGDVLTRQTRGVSEGDIMHQIRTASGALLDTMIDYDSKEVASVTKKDIDKGKYYREHHKTDYFIIVSSKLPKCVKNGYIGKKDGVWVVHRDVISDVTRIMRSAIIEIGRLSASKKSQETKEAKLYEYLTGREFSRMIESLCENHTKLVDLQTKEQKEHEILWNKRGELHDQLINSYIDISSQIEAIIQEQPTEEVGSTNGK